MAWWRRTIWQRWRTHYSRDLLTKETKASQPWVATLGADHLRPARRRRGSRLVRPVVAGLEAKLFAAAGHLSAAREDLLAFTAVPARSGARSGCPTRRNG
jgi:putative transposase